MLFLINDVPAYYSKLVGLLQKHGMIGEGKMVSYPKTVKECLSEWCPSSGN